MRKRLTLTSFHYHQRLSRSKLCFMSTIRPSLSSVIYQNLIILHAGNAEQAPFFIFLLPRCHSSVNCRHHRPASPPASLPPHPVLLLFTMFYSFFLSTSYFIYCSLPDTRTLFCSISHSAPRPLNTVAPCISS